MKSDFQSESYEYLQQFCFNITAGVRTSKYSQLAVTLQSPKTCLSHSTHRLHLHEDPQFHCLSKSHPSSCKFHTHSKQFQCYSNSVLSHFHIFQPGVVYSKPNAIQVIRTKCSVYISLSCICETQWISLKYFYSIREIYSSTPLSPSILLRAK